MNEFNFVEGILRKKTSVAEPVSQTVESSVEAEPSLEPVSPGDILLLVDEIEENFKQIANADKLVNKLEELEDRIEGIDKALRESVKEKIGVDWVGHFYEGIAAARQKALGYFFVKESGEKLLPNEYFEMIKNTEDGKFMVKKAGEWQLFDKEAVNN